MRRSSKSLLWYQTTYEVTGAIGAAAIAAEYMKKRRGTRDEGRETNFRGFEKVSTIEYKVESFTCEHCPNHCEIKKVQLPEAEPLYYGSRCDRYNLKKKTQKAKGLGVFEYRRRMLFECAGLDDKSPSTVSSGQSNCSKRQDALVGAKRPAVARKAMIGIPMALMNWQLLPLFAQFFKAMGFDVITSGLTDKRIIRMGVESVNAQPCFPVKAAYGHIAELIEKKVDYIFLPSIVSMTASFLRTSPISYVRMSSRWSIRRKRLLIISSEAQKYLLPPSFGGGAETFAKEFYRTW